MENHTLNSARFVDSKHENIEAIWIDNDDKTVRSEFIYRDEDSHMYKNLMEHTDLETVMRYTFDYNEAQENDMKEAMKQMYPPEVIIETHERVIELEKTHFEFEKLINNELSDEDLFRLKIIIFENESIKKSKDRKLKTSIRKSKNPLEILSMFYDATQTS